SVSGLGTAQSLIETLRYRSQGEAKVGGQRVLGVSYTPCFLFQLPSNFAFILIALVITLIRTQVSCYALTMAPRNANKYLSPNPSTTSNLSLPNVDTESAA